MLIQFPNAIASNFISDQEKIASGCDAAIAAQSKATKFKDREATAGQSRTWQARVWQFTAEQGTAWQGRQRSQGRTG